MTAHVEITDTFGGEANYCWVRRDIIPNPIGTSTLSIIRRAKRIAGWQGIRCTKHDDGTTITLRPAAGICQIMFITFPEG